MARASGGDNYKKCAECAAEKPRYTDFAPRWGRCPRHKHLKHEEPSYDPNCGQCVERRNRRTRQPRCYVCDAARKGRFKIEAALKRAVTEHGLNAKDVVKRFDSSVRLITVYDLTHAGDPSGLAEELQRIANGKVKLDIRPFTPAMSQADLIQPLVLDEPPPGSRTCAPIYDAAATAGTFGRPGEARVDGYVETGARTLRGDFALRVRGRSMLPVIRHNSLCVFRPIDYGTHLNGRIVLAQGREELDPEQGGRLTVKRLILPPTATNVIHLVPTNVDFEPIYVHEGDDVRIVAQYLRMVSA